MAPVGQGLSHMKSTCPRAVGENRAAALNGHNYGWGIVRPLDNSRSATIYHLNAKPNRGNGLEIYDFHESWLKDFERYKCQLNASGPYQLVNSFLNATPYAIAKLPQLALTDHATRLRPNAGQCMRVPQAQNLDGLTALVNAAALVANATGMQIANAQTKSVKEKKELFTNAAQQISAFDASRRTNRLKRKCAARKNRRQSNKSKADSGHKNNADKKRQAKLDASESSSLSNAQQPQASQQTVSPNRQNSSQDSGNQRPADLASKVSLSKRMTGGGMTTNRPPLKSLGKLVLKENLEHSFDDDFKKKNIYVKTTSKTNLRYALNRVETTADNNIKDGVITPRDSVTINEPSLEIDDMSAYSDSDPEDAFIGQPFYLRGGDSESRQSDAVHNAYADLIGVGRAYNCSLETHRSQTHVSAPRNCTTHFSYYRPNSVLSPSLFPNVPPYLNYSSHADRGPKIPAALQHILKWKLTAATPKIVKQIIENSGFRLIRNSGDWVAIWERHMRTEAYKSIRSYQKYNHMPGSFRMGRKDCVWRNIRRKIQRFGSKEFGFMQQTFILPDELELLRQAWPRNAAKMTKWIVKPPASARGLGIRIVNRWSQFSKGKPLVIQKYIERPFLINDNKFDLRIYVVLTSVNPLKIYMHKEGLARFACEKYNSTSATLDSRYMHLTNYSINKHSKNYRKNEDFNSCSGHKWTLQSLWSYLEERGINTKMLWAKLRDLVIKSIISGETALVHNQDVIDFRYNCFELYGFDILLDSDLVPWLLEINVSPSLNSEQRLDQHVKGPLIQAIFNTVLYQVPPKLTKLEEKEVIDELHLPTTTTLAYDERIFTTSLTSNELLKQAKYNRCSTVYRKDYIEAILDNLLPADIRCLIIHEDELNRCSPLECIFPTADTYKYLKFLSSPRYYNRLLDAWETKYSHCRANGIDLLRKFCSANYHVDMSNTASEPESNGLDVGECIAKTKNLDDSADDEPSSGFSSSSEYY